MKKHIEIPFGDKIMRGYLDYSCNENCAIVVHGIGGNKLGSKFIFKQFSEMSLESNISTVRMDFIGTGESDGDFYFTNHLEQAHQLNTIISYTRDILKMDKIHLVGTSVGCLVILNTLKLYDCKVASVSLWNPNIDVEKYSSEYSKFDEEIDLCGLKLSANYKKNLTQLTYKQDFSKYNLSIMHGENDYNYNNEYVYNFVVSNNCKYSIIRNANHLFESTDARNNLFLCTIMHIQDSNCIV